MRGFAITAAVVRFSFEFCSLALLQGAGAITVESTPFCCAHLIISLVRLLAAPFQGFFFALELASVSGAQDLCQVLQSWLVLVTSLGGTFHCKVMPAASDPSLCFALPFVS